MIKMFRASNGASNQAILLLLYNIQFFIASNIGASIGANPLIIYPGKRIIAMCAHNETTI
jgi:hypothetical protein